MHIHVYGAANPSINYCNHGLSKKNKKSATARTHPNFNRCAKALRMAWKSLTGQHISASFNFSRSLRPGPIDHRNGKTPGWFFLIPGDFAGIWWVLQTQKQSKHISKHTNKMDDMNACYGRYMGIFCAVFFFKDHLWMGIVAEVAEGAAPSDSRH